MNQYEIVYFDVDGTLFDNKNNAVPASTINALNLLKKAGYKVALCTGRNITAIDMVKDLIDWDGYVLSNGCAVYDRTLNPLFEHPFDADFMRRLVQASEAPLFLEGDQMYLTKEPHGPLKEALSFFNSDTELSIQMYENQKVFNAMSYNFDELNFDLIPDFEEHATTHKDILGNVEIVPSGTGKHLGCNVLNTHLGVQRFVGFGDGENDIQFLKHATVSVAMGNAREHIQAAADYVTTHIDDDGIMNGLKLIGLL